MHSARQVAIVLAIGLLVSLGGVWFIHHGSTPTRPYSAPRTELAAPQHSGSADQSSVDSDGGPSAPVQPPRSKLDISPTTSELAGVGDGCQLVLTRHLPDGTAEDLTRLCQYEVVPSQAAEVSPTGFVRALAAGEATVTAYHKGEELTAALVVPDSDLPVGDFALDIVPILTKAGCNSGQCHGAAQGKGGLHFSLFGYHPESDHAVITRDMEGRRIDRASPESSLILLKPSMAVPHGGRRRLPAESAEYARLRRWIETGTPWRDESRGRLVRLVVEPQDSFLVTAPAEQQLRAVAEYADGTQRDVTRLCLFVSNDPGTVTVNKHGLARMLRRGQADVVVRFTNQVTTVRLAAPFNDMTDFDYASVPARSFVDEQVVQRLQHMRLPVSPRSSDAEFLRRVYFDLVGHMPDPTLREDANVVPDFLASDDPDKRDKLIDKLLAHPDFVAFWALKFGDHWQLNSATMGSAVGSYRVWLSNQLRLDKSGHATPYDELVRTLLLAKGSLKPGRMAAPAVYYAAPQEPSEIAEQVARRFLGIRIRCARCHDHPLDVWTQDDYYGFAAFFGRVRVDVENGLGQEVKLVEENAVRHLRTGETPVPKYLGGEQVEIADDADPRGPLVEWMMDPDNPRFARMAVNWVWAHVMGRGLVEPVDDLRQTNPATDRALLDALAEHFRETGYDLRGLIRTICQSEAYQRASTPVAGNEPDEQFFSHALLKPLTAHQTADAIAQVTGVPHGYGQNRAKNTRAIEINDPNVNDYLLDILGRCDRTGGCEVGALARPASLKQSLHLIVGEAINQKLSRQGSVLSHMAQAARDVDPANLPHTQAVQIESLYLRAYCRRPAPEEITFWQKFLSDSDDYATALEDMLWAILNSREFAFNH